MINELPVVHKVAYLRRRVIIVLRLHLQKLISWNYKIKYFTLQQLHTFTNYPNDLFIIMYGTFLIILNSNQSILCLYSVPI